MIMTRTFYGVGQGAFYCECFDEARFQVIYDCGSISKSRKELLKNNIDKLNPKYETVLFISHFHADHVNGIPLLLKHCNVKWIFFPYLTKSNRKFLIFYNSFVTKIYRKEIESDIYDFETEFAIDFLKQPIEAIKKYLQVDFVEEQTDQPEKIKLYAIEQTNNSYDEDLWDDVKFVKSGTNIMETLRSDLSGQLFFKDFWEYYPYNLECDEKIKILLQKINVAFKTAITVEKLPEQLNLLYKNSKNHRAIKKIFNALGDLNTNSLILISTNHNPKSSFLYTGDYDAKKHFKELNDFFSSIKVWDTIGGIQIPHHGSAHNFNEKLILSNNNKSKGYNFEPIYIISYGKNNTFGHPSPQVITKLSGVYLIHENINLTVNISLSKIQNSCSSIFYYDLCGKQICNEKCIKDGSFVKLDKYYVIVSHKNNQYREYYLCNGYNIYIRNDISINETKNVLKRIIHKTDIDKTDPFYMYIPKRTVMMLSCCMKDGILFPEAYSKSNLKVAFILKEPYAEWDETTNSPSDCDFDFFDIIRDLKYHYENDLNKTWLKVAAIAYSLKNSTQYAENLTYEQVVEGLSCVAWINLSKTPWKTTTKIDEAYRKRVAVWEPVVKEQLIEAAPDIVFYGNTWDASTVNPVEPDVQWQDGFCTNTKKYVYTSEGGKQFRIYISQYKDSGKLLVNGYHPRFGNSSEWQTGFIKDYINSMQ